MAGGQGSKTRVVWPGVKAERRVVRLKTHLQLHESYLKNFGIQLFGSGRLVPITTVVNSYSTFLYNTYIVCILTRSTEPFQNVFSLIELNPLLAGSCGHARDEASEHRAF